MIGRLQRRLRTLGVARNTYIVFSSDNGFHLGQHRLTPGKLTAYDPDVRVPLIVTGPGVPAGRTVDAMTENTDLCPTFAELAGAPAPPRADGRSLVPLLHPGSDDATAGDWRDAVLIEHHGNVNGASDPDLPPAGSGNPPSYEALRSNESLYVEYADGERELYDLAADPFQLHNLADEVAARAARETQRPARRDGELSRPRPVLGGRAPAVAPVVSAGERVAPGEAGIACEAAVCGDERGAVFDRERGEVGIGYAVAGCPGLAAEPLENAPVARAGGDGQRVWLAPQLIGESERRIDRRGRRHPARMCDDAQESAQHQLADSVRLLRDDRLAQPLGIALMLGCLGAICVDEDVDVAEDQRSFSSGRPSSIRSRSAALSPMSTPGMKLSPGTPNVGSFTRLRRLGSLLRRTTIRSASSITAVSVVPRSAASRLASLSRWSSRSSVVRMQRNISPMQKSA